MGMREKNEEDVESINRRKVALWRRNFLEGGGGGGGGGGLFLQRRVDLSRPKRERETERDEMERRRVF